jgi:hypothetical protein
MQWEYSFKNENYVRIIFSLNNKLLLWEYSLKNANYLMNIYKYKLCNEYTPMEMKIMQKNTHIKK